MKIIFVLALSIYSASALAKSVALTMRPNEVYYLEYQVKNYRTMGLVYSPINDSGGRYKYNGQRYGLILSSKDLNGGPSFDLELGRDVWSRTECDSCVKENSAQYYWSFSVQQNWVWDWGLYIYLGAGFYYQHKTYDYRGSSFIGPQIFLPLGLGLTF